MAEVGYVGRGVMGGSVVGALAEQVEAVGAPMLDAPVSGTSITVDQGKASLMVGGSREAFERARPMLESIRGRRRR